MAIRPIDANVAMKKIREYMEDFPKASTWFATCQVILSMLGDENQIPTLTHSNEPERAGLYGKYTVYKNKDGSLVTDCFILRPAKDPAAVTALRAYAAATDNAELAVDIINWVGAEPTEPLELEELRDMLTCEGCMYEPNCSASVHCQSCSRMGTDHHVYSKEGQKDGKSR